MKARRRPIAGLAFGLILLFMVEMGLRLAGVQPAYVAGSIAGWRVTANLQQQPMQGPRDGHTFHISTNDDGLRTTLPKQRSPGIARVALLGDSTVFGWGVDDGDTLADGTQAALDAEGAPIEILNAGQPGYSTTQAAWLIGEVVAAYQPDLVVLFLPQHDWNRVLVSDRESVGNPAGPRAAARVWVARNLRLYQLLRQAIFPDAADPSQVPERADAEPRVPRVSDAERAQALLEIQAVLAPWGGRLALGLLPFLADLQSARPHPRTASLWAEAQALPLFDLRGCCGPNGGGLVLPDDPGHLRREGNFQVGASLAPLLAEALPGGRGSPED